MKLTLEIELPEGYSDETYEQTRKALEHYREAITLFAAKQEAYGRGNIAIFGERGVCIRSSDKQQRLNQLLFGERKNDAESVRDTWIDKANYGIIGLMCHDGEW